MFNKSCDNIYILVYQNQHLALKPIVFWRGREFSNFQDLFSVSFSKLNKYLEAHSVSNSYW